jgi:chromosome segregation ATPase
MRRMESTGLVLLLLVSGMALAQPSPPGGGGGGGFGGGQQGGPGGGPGNGPGGGPPPFLQNLPEVNLSALSGARSEARAAHTEWTQAQSTLTQISRAKQDEFDSRPEVVELIRSVAADKAKYDQLAAPVLKALTTQPSYQSAQTVTSDARKNVETLRTQPSATAQARLTAAQNALAAKDALTRIETEALSADAPVAAARQEYAQVAASLAAMRAQFEVAMKQDGDYLQARRNLDDARARATEADAKLADVQKELAEQKAARAAAMAAMRDQMRQAKQGGGGGGRGGPPGR